MAASVHRKVGGGLVEVRLSEVPLELRRRVAELIVELGGLAQLDAITYQLVAISPRQDPSILVSAEKAARVRAGRLPTGAMPKVWEW